MSRYYYDMVANNPHYVILGGEGETIAVHSSRLSSHQLLWKPDTESSFNVFFLSLLNNKYSVHIAIRLSNENPELNRAESLCEWVYRHYLNSAIVSINVSKQATLSLAWSPG